MSFANPYFLLALAGVAVPVLIHLLTRDRVQHVAFSTLRFFAKGAKLVVRRKKFQELLLILMRVAMVALLAFIFARPFFKSKAGDSATVSTARVIIMDTSGSMRRAGLPEAMKKEALGALENLREGEDAAAVVTFTDAPTILEPLGKKITPMKAAVAEVSPGYGGTNIAEALRKANELLRGVQAKQKEIVLVSDLQREGWQYFKGDWKLADDVKLVVKGLKPTETKSSLSIVDAKAPDSLVLDKQPSSIAARIANYSDQPRTDVDVTLTLHGKKVATQKINVRANSTASVRFRHVFDTPGDNPGSLTLGAAPNEEVFYFNARAIPRIPVLVVNGRPSPDPQTDAAFFLGKALAPTDEAPFEVKVVAAGQVTPKDVAAASVVIVANVGQAPAPLAGALMALLERGGGVLFLPGDQVKAATFNAEFGKVAPFKLRAVLQARPANGEPAESLTRVEFEHPVFEVFALPHHGDLTLPKFTQYWETTDTQLSRVLARFGDGRPAILEREIGKGVAMALVSALDANWNDFAYRTVFLPYLHQTIRYLAVRTGQRTGYASGDLLPVPEGSALRDPNGKTQPEASAAQPGFYHVLNKEGKQDFTYAVNGSFAEADPATVAADEVIAAIERAPGEVLGALDMDATPGAGKQDSKLWWYLLCGLVLLTLAELVVGNKTLRH